jgi:hypothetical protein
MPSDYGDLFRIALDSAEQWAAERELKWRLRHSGQAVKPPCDELGRIIPYGVDRKSTEYFD